MNFAFTNKMPMPLRFYPILALFFVLQPTFVVAQNMLYQDPQNYIWRVEGSQLRCFDGYTQRIFSTNNSLPNVPIQRLFFDAQKRLWVFGKNASTLVFLDSLHHVNLVQNAAGLRNFTINAIWQSNDTLFLRDSSTQLVLFFDAQKNLLQRFYKPLSPPQYAPFLKPIDHVFFDEKSQTIQFKSVVPAFIFNFPIQKAFSIEDKKWLLITPQNQLILADETGKKNLIQLITNYLPEFKRQNVTFTCLAATSDYLLVGHTEGVIFLKKTTDFKQKIKLNAADYNITNTKEQRLDVAANYVRIGYVYQIKISENGCFLASQNGLFFLNTKDKILQKLNPNYQDVGAVHDSLAYGNADFLIFEKTRRIKFSSKITQLTVLPNSSFLFGTTEGGGIFYIQNGEKHFVEDLNDQVFNQLSADIDCIWALSGSQLVKIKSENGNLTSSRFDLPLPADAFVKYGNKIHFFGREGGFVLPIDDFKIPQNPPKMRIEGIKIGGLERTLAPEFDNLETSERSLIARFSGIDPLSNGDILYRYRLINLPPRYLTWVLRPDTAQWTYLRSRELVQPLEAGNYQLELAAVNHFGITTPNPLSIRFSVLPPFWERWWFLLLILGALVGMVYGIFKERENRLKQRNERLQLQKNLVEVELQALQAQMNTHFVANALTAIQGFVMRNDKLKANKYIVDFSELMRLFLDSSRQKKHPLEKELTLLERYIALQKLFYSFDYKVVIGEEIYPTEMDVPTALYQPFIENAIIHGLRHRHTEGGILRLNFERTKESLTCTIEDNGIGREQSWKINQENRAFQKFSSQVSTQIIEKRRQTINQATGDNAEKVEIQYTDLKNTDGSAAGTQVRIIIFFETQSVEKSENQ